MFFFISFSLRSVSLAPCVPFFLFFFPFSLSLFFSSPAASVIIDSQKLFSSLLKPARRTCIFCSRCVDTDSSSWYVVLMCVVFYNLTLLYQTLFHTSAPEQVLYAVDILYWVIRTSGRMWIEFSPWTLTNISYILLERTHFNFIVLKYFDKQWWNEHIFTQALNLKGSFSISKIVCSVNVKVFRDRPLCLTRNGRFIAPIKPTKLHLQNQRF